MGVANPSWTSTRLRSRCGDRALGVDWAARLLLFDSQRFSTLGRAVLDYDIAAAHTVGQWHHVAVAMDATNSVTFYLDGAWLGTVIGSQPARTPNSNYVLGAWNPGGGIPEFFNGDIDDVRIIGM